jgi:hypothetical protein
VPENSNNKWTRNISIKRVFGRPKEMTTRLQKFIERGAHEEGPGRVAYVLDVSALPRPAKGKEWQRIDSFSAAEEVLNDPNLKSVFKTAIDQGCAIVQAT